MSSIKDIIARGMCERPDDVVFASGGTGDVPFVVHVRAWQLQAGAASRAIAALDAAGFVVVPKEPTEGMRKAAVAAECDNTEETYVTDIGAQQAYIAMLAARPKP